MTGTALVHGGTGFLGRHLLPALRAAGCAVRATCRPGRKPPAIDGVDWLPVNLASERRADLPARCDAVIHLAQGRRWRAFPDAAADTFNINVASVQRAADHALRSGARRLVFVSTGTVYPASGQVSCEEDAIPLHAAGRSFYAVTKLAAELILRPYAELLPVLVLRLFTPYGSGQDRAMLLPKVLARVRAGESIQLHGQDGLETNPVAASEVAETIVRTLALDRSQTLNVAGPERLRLRHIAETMGRALGVEPRFECQSGGTAPRIVGATDALHAALGWSPVIRFEDGLQRWLAEEKESPRSYPGSGDGTQQRTDPGHRRRRLHRLARRG